MSTVEIRVAGTIGPLVAAGLPGFSVIVTDPITVISGSLDRGDTLADIVALLVRHGTRPVDARVFPSPPPA